MSISVSPNATKHLYLLIGLLLLTVLFTACLPSLAGAEIFSFKPNLPTLGEPALEGARTDTDTIPNSDPLNPQYFFIAFASLEAGDSEIMTDGDGWAFMPTPSGTPGVSGPCVAFGVLFSDDRRTEVKGFDVKNSGSTDLNIRVVTGLDPLIVSDETFTIEPGQQTLSLTGHVSATDSQGLTGTLIIFDETSDLSFNNFQLDVYDAPKVSTNGSAGAITQNTATIGGDVTDAGLETVTARGICWSTSSRPTISDTADEKTTDGTGAGTFTSTLTGLAPDTLYYARAYATSDIGTNYGQEITFTTSSDALVPPTPTPASSTWSLAVLAIAGLCGATVLQRRTSSQ